MDLKTIRFQRRLTQYDLSRKTGLSQATISLIERGYKKPGETMHKALAKACGVRSEDLSFDERREFADCSAED